MPAMRGRSVTSPFTRSHHDDVPWMRPSAIASATVSATIAMTPPTPHAVGLFSFFDWLSATT